MLSRQQQLAALNANDYDLVIVGGGVFGACALWEATLRGLKAVLFEAFDFCSGASANSYKIVHGGTRYVQHFDFPRVRSSSRERRAMLTIAPHLVEPLPILIPTYGWGKLGKPYLGAGLTLYDMLTYDRNKGIGVPERCLKSTQLLSREQVLNEFPDIDAKGLTGACVFEDGRFYNPTRLVFAFISSALARGAQALNYCPVEDLLIENDRVVGVRLADKLSGQELTVKSKMVLNTAGPWAERILERALPGTYETQSTYSRDACFVIKRRFPSHYTLAFQGQTKDPDALLSRPARHLFLSPWRDYTLVGVWHKVTAEHPEAIAVEEAELQTFIDEVNAGFPELALSLDDVLFYNAGLVPFGENEEGSENLSYGKRSLLTDHQTTEGLEGLVTLIGVRYTMARGEAEKALDIVQRKLGSAPRRAGSESVKLIGADFSSFAGLKSELAQAWPIELSEPCIDALAHNYGSGYRVLLPLLESDPGLAAPVDGTCVTKAEVVHSCRAEMVNSLADLVFRRTDIATGGHPGDAALACAARIAQKELGWTEQRLDSEMAAVAENFPIAIKRMDSGKQMGKRKESEA